MAGRVGRRRGAAVAYLVFDLLWLDGRLLTGLPYVERRQPLDPPRPRRPAPVFVRPELAVEVSFLGWESGRLRHPAYSGLSRLL